MNIKSVQRGYANMTMLERLTLADLAASRNDEREIEAVILASPRVQYSQPDFLELFVKIDKFRLCNLVTRLSYIMQFDTFCLADNGEDGVQDHARLAAYLYVRATDSWRAICEEFSLCTDFNKQICQHLYSVELLEISDSILREFAFTESEAKDYIKQQYGSSKIQTIADEIKTIREVIGLPYY